jgi:hypothetical protein
MNLKYISYQLGEEVATAHTRRIGNTDEISFHESVLAGNPEAEEGAEWGKILYYGLFTSETNTTPYAWGRLNNYKLLTGDNAPDDWGKDDAVYYSRTDGGQYKDFSGESTPEWESGKYYSNYVYIGTHQKFLFREGHFELYLDGDELLFNADGDVIKE